MTIRYIQVKVKLQIQVDGPFQQETFLFGIGFHQEMEPLWRYFTQNSAMLEINDYVCFRKIGLLSEMWTMTLLVSQIQTWKCAWGKSYYDDYINRKADAAILTSTYAEDGTRTMCLSRG